jgi:hypothetical protein
MLVMLITYITYWYTALIIWFKQLVPGQIPVCNFLFCGKISTKDLCHHYNAVDKLIRIVLVKNT